MPCNAPAIAVEDGGLSARSSRGPRDANEMLVSRGISRAADANARIRGGDAYGKFGSGPAMTGSHTHTCRPLVRAAGAVARSSASSRSPSPRHGTTAPATAVPSVAASPSVPSGAVARPQSPSPPRRVLAVEWRSPTTAVGGSVSGPSPRGNLSARCAGLGAGPSRVASGASTASTGVVDLAVTARMTLWNRLTVAGGAGLDLSASAPNLLSPRTTLPSTLAAPTVASHSAAGGSLELSASTPNLTIPRPTAATRVIRSPSPGGGTVATSSTATIPPGVSLCSGRAVYATTRSATYGRSPGGSMMLHHRRKAPAAVRVLRSPSPPQAPLAAATPTHGAGLSAAAQGAVGCSTTARPAHAVAASSVSMTLAPRGLRGARSGMALGTITDGVAFGAGFPAGFNAGGSAGHPLQDPAATSAGLADVFLSPRTAGHTECLQADQVLRRQGGVASCRARSPGAWG